MTKTTKPYGKRERLIRWQAARRGEVVQAIRVGRRQAELAIGKLAVSQAVASFRKPSLAERLREFGLDCVAKVVCWAIERNMWKNATELDYKMEVSEWLTMMTTGRKTCQLAR